MAERSLTHRGMRLYPIDRFVRLCLGTPLLLLGWRLWLTSHGYAYASFVLGGILVATAAVGLRLFPSVSFAIRFLGQKLIETFLDFEISR
jgi:hypothetical protein